MRTLRPIPRQYLSDQCVVRERQDDGSFGRGRVINHVRIQRIERWVAEDHRSTACAGTLFVDAVNSLGAFEIAAGSRISVGGNDYLASRVQRFEGANGRVHHWEVALS